jgi:hypothetical protein
VKHVFVRFYQQSLRFSERGAGFASPQMDRTAHLAVSATPCACKKRKEIIPFFLTGFLFHAIIF